jgi:hypothetical protein
MKRISTALLVASFAAISSAALATDSVLPQAAQEFPPIQSQDTYMLRHVDDIATQRGVPGPSSASMFDPIQAHDTYMLRHLSDIETQPSVPFPTSTPD